MVDLSKVDMKKEFLEAKEFSLTGEEEKTIKELD